MWGVSLSRLPSQLTVGNRGTRELATWLFAISLCFESPGHSPVEKNHRSPNCHHRMAGCAAALPQPAGLLESPV